MLTEHIFKTNYYAMLVHFSKHTNILVINIVIIFKLMQAILNK